MRDLKIDSTNKLKGYHDIQIQTYFDLEDYLKKLEIECILEIEILHLIEIYYLGL
jgi:hypothetical protein